MERYDAEVLATCQRLHSARYGIADRLPEDTERALLAWLEKRRDEWVPLKDAGGAFDACVLALINATIVEYSEVRP